MKKTLAMLAFLGTTASLSAQTVPQPDKDGVYTSGIGLTPAKLVHAVPASYPADPGLAGVKHICALRIVVGADGTFGAIQVLNDKASSFDDAAIAAVKQSQFEPAIYKGHPVPTYRTLWVLFNIRNEPAIPMEAKAGQNGVSPPIALDSVAEENSELARSGKIPGVVWVSLLVTEKGIPTDIRLVRPLGNGRDEDFLIAVQKYRFRPATIYGVPVPFPITMQVNSHSY